MTAEQYRAVGPYIDLAERLGTFRRVCGGRQSQFRSIDVPRQDWGAEYGADPQCRIGRSA